MNFGAAIKAYNAKRREVDLQLLWPTCYDIAEGSLEIARHLFLAHAGSDSAWVELSSAEIADIVGKLEAP